MGAGEFLVPIPGPRVVGGTFNPFAGLIATAAGFHLFPSSFLSFPVTFLLAPNFFANQTIIGLLDRSLRAVDSGPDAFRRSGWLR